MNFDNLKDQVSNLTLYDIKAGVRKVQNAVMNYTEMEAKVREATNNEPWGASSTLQQEIANGTYNYQLLNEIMPMIYKRFTEKAAEEWRQIYKARTEMTVEKKGLQLLEYLIKHGSERVVDDARSHISLLKMLRQFHFIDQNGKDQGINVRNRAKELAELLSDVDRIRAERKKSKATRSKYTGVEGGASLGGMSGGSRYGGFGSEDQAGYGGYSGGVYGDGGGFGGATGGFQDSGASSGSQRDRFEEYDEYDEGAVAASGRRKGDSSGRAGRERSTKKPQPPPKKEPEVDLFNFGDEEKPSVPSAANGKKAAALNDFGTLQSGGADDDDFDDFQSASPQAAPAKPNYASLPKPTSTSTTTASTQFAAPQPVSGSKGANMNDLVGFASISPAPSSTTTPSNPSTFSAPSLAPQSQAPRPTGFQGGQPNYFTSVPAPSTQTPSSTRATGTPMSGNPTNVAPKPAASSGDAFGSIWNSASAGIKKSNTPNSQSPNLASMAKQQASAGIWGAPAASQPAKPAAAPQASQSLGNGLDDLLG